VLFWSQHVSFILVGIIVITSIRGLLITLTKFFYAIASSKSSNAIVLCLAEVMACMYFVSVLLMRMNVPEEYRLGVMWPGAEPVKDQFNETYFSIAKDIVNKAANYSINILLDMHQDVLLARFCGEGVPDWTIDPEVAKNFPEPLSRRYIVDNVTGHPTSEDCAKHAWAEYYPTEATSAMRYLS
uniref:Abscisic acid G-protein coupled receptor-like domain-containing protein n=1 Tax=Amphimedon queenslandica TaxID=400682 RepID=A0A1X7SJD0_AMPQE